MIQQQAGRPGGEALARRLAARELPHSAYRAPAAWGLLGCGIALNLTL